MDSIGYQVVRAHTTYRRSTDPVHPGTYRRGDGSTDLDPHIAVLGKDGNSPANGNESPDSSDPNPDAIVQERPTDESGG